MAGTLSLISVIAYVMAGVFLVLAIVFFIVFKIPTVVGDLSGKNARRSIELLRANNEKNNKSSSAIDYSKNNNQVAAKAPVQAKSNPVVSNKSVAGNKQVANNTNQMVETGLLGGAKYSGASVDETTPLNGVAFGDDETRPLNGSSFDENETMPLNASDTFGEGETMPLNAGDAFGEGETMPLNATAFEEGATMPLNMDSNSYDENETAPLNMNSKNDDYDEMGTMPLNATVDEEEGTTQLVDNRNNRNMNRPGGKRIRIIEEVMLVHTSEVVV